MAINNIEPSDYKNLTPFKAWLINQINTWGINNFPFLESDFDKLTNYGMMMKLMKAVNQVITNENLVEQDMKRLFDAFTELVNYINNLDLQDEVNNKLDEMAQDGTLDYIIEKYILNNIQSNLNFRIKKEYNSSLTDLYEGYAHYYLQGFCKTNDNKIIMGLINPSHVDNIVKLVEYDIETGNVIRHSYIDGNHCNSITYNKNTNKLYIASNSKNENGVEVDCNDLIIVDYNTLRVDNIVQLTNLDGQRLRSVYYDEDENILYGGNFNTIYEIDLESETIDNLVVLSNANIQPDMTYQVLKRYKNYFIGIQISSLIIWNLDGSIYREINIDRTSQNLLIGEPEDFILNENGDIIVGCITRLNEYTNYYSVKFYYSNIYTNTNNIIRPSFGGDESNYIIITCDNTSTHDYEDGTPNYPFKSLQKAINFASNSSRMCRIYLNGTRYETTMIRGLSNVRIIPSVDNIIIDGIILYDTNVVLVSNNHLLTINGIVANYSKLDISANVTNQLTINNLNVDTINTNYCLSGRNSIINLENCNIIGNNEVDNISLSIFSILNLINCIFDGYTNNKAIYINNNSKCNLRNCTFNITSSTTQQIINVKNKSILNTQNTLNSINDYEKDKTSKIYGTKIIQPIETTFYGDVADLNMNYDNISVKSYAPGYTTAYKETILKLVNDYNTRYIVNNLWPGSSTLKTGTALLKVYDNKLKIEINRRLNISNGGTFTYENITSNTPETPSDTLGITGIEYFDI